MKSGCPLHLHCEKCVQSEVEKFNKIHPSFPNGHDDWSAELEFRELESKIDTCEQAINQWKNNGADSLKQELRNSIASVAIYLLKQKPVQPITHDDDRNLEKLKINRALLARVAQFFNIEPRKLLKKLI